MKVWNYTGEADITIGEVRLSNTAKIILIILVLLLGTAAGLAIYFRSYIYDYIADPEIILSDKEVSIEVNNELNPEEYIINKDAGYTYTVEGVDAVNTKKLGEYSITYTSKNSVKSKTVNLKINVVDTTPPEITLTDDMLKLIRGDDTDKFNAKDYIAEVKDNYSKAEKILIEFTKDIDFDQDLVQVIYSATDEQGNQATKDLTIAVFDSEEELKKELAEESSEEQEESTEKQETTEKQTEAQTQAQTQAPTTEYVPPATEAPTEAATEAPSSDPWISGVHDVTVAVGTDFGSMQASLISGVSGSGTVYCDYSSVNLTVAGTYPVYWSSDDGASATCYVTVTE